MAGVAGGEGRPSFDILNARMRVEVDPADAPPTADIGRRRKRWFAPPACQWVASVLGRIVQGIGQPDSVEPTGIAGRLR
jgi:hypothetical protein